MLVAHALNKSFGSQVALDTVDMVVAPGQITAVIGPSGSGKTTLLRTLSMLDPPDSGTITVDGRECSFRGSETAEAVAPWPQITVVFQQLFLWPHMTMRQNIELPLRRRRSLEAQSLVTELVDEFALADLLDRYPNQASVGQRQLVAFVRAVALRPRYLLLDEITSSLDVEHVARVLARLSRLRADGTGILLITHLIGFAKGSADQVVFMEHGRVVEAGDSSLLTAPHSARLQRFLSIMRGAV